MECLRYVARDCRKQFVAVVPPACFLQVFCIDLKLILKIPCSNIHEGALKQVKWGEEGCSRNTADSPANSAVSHVPCSFMNVCSECKCAPMSHVHTSQPLKKCPLNAWADSHLAQVYNMLWSVALVK